MKNTTCRLKEKSSKMRLHFLISAHQLQGRPKMLEIPELLLRRAANRKWNQPKRKKCVEVNKADRSWRSEERFGIRHGDAEFGVSPGGFWFCFVQYFLTILQFATVTYILCHYMLEACALFLISIYRGLQLRDCMSLRRDFELWTFKHC